MRERVIVGTGWVTGLVSAALVAIGLSGCAQDSNSGRNTGRAAPTPASAITLAPHLTELIFAAGAGDKLVGTVEYSDYPPAAISIARVGDAFRLDYEAIGRLQPDVILAWQGGNPADVIQRLRDLDYRVLALEASSLESVGENLRRIGVVMGTSGSAAAAAAEFDRSLEALRSRYQDANPLRVFYQVSWEPLFTISDRHVIGQAIKLCGGRNVFAALNGLSPAVSLEAVLETRPDVIVASNFGAERPDAATGLAGWSRWAHVPAVKRGNLFFVDADLMVRPGSRIIDGVRQLCDRLDQARERL